jgi:hypothetical protein
VAGLLLAARGLLAAAEMLLAVGRLAAMRKVLSINWHRQFIIIIGLFLCL